MLSEEKKATLDDVGKLLLRVGIAGMMIGGHGWGKLMSFSARHASFPDPLGVGNSLSMALAVGGEVFAPLLIALGLFTRAAAVPAAITMAVAAFVVHGQHHMFMSAAKAAGESSSKEFALLYFVPFLALLFTGPGRLSLDAVVMPKLGFGPAKKD